MNTSRPTPVNGQKYGSIKTAVGPVSTERMAWFTEGDRVRIDIPDETDQTTGSGTIVTVLEDDAYVLGGDDREETIFRGELPTGETTDLRWRDLRSP